MRDAGMFDDDIISAASDAILFERARVLLRRGPIVITVQVQPLRFSSDWVTSVDPHEPLQISPKSIGSRHGCVTIGRGVKGTHFRHVAVNPWA